MAINILTFHELLTFIACMFSVMTFVIVARELGKRK
jgi:hypothetical protein